MRESISASVTGRRNARRARFAVMRRAQALSWFLLRPANEDPPPALGLRHARRVERPHHLDATHQPRLAIAPAERVARQEADEFIRFDAGALDERHGHVVRARLHLHRNVGEPFHDLGPSGRAAAIDDPQVVGTAHRRAKHFPTVDEDDQRVASLHRARIEIDAHIRNREPVLAVRGKVVPESHAAAGAERKPVDVGRLIADFRLGIGGAGHLGHGFADGQSRRDARGGDILVEKGGRDAQRRGDVVEAVDFDLGRQEFRGVELDAQQIVDGGSELRARQPLNRHVAGDGGRRRAPSSVVFHPGHERVDLALFRLAASRRRHQPAAQLAHGGFPDVGVLANGVEAQRVERHASGTDPRVMAPGAVRLERFASLRSAAVLYAAPLSLSKNRSRHGGKGDTDTDGPIHGLVSYLVAPGRAGAGAGIHQTKSPVRLAGDDSPQRGSLVNEN